MQLKLFMQAHKTKVKTKTRQTEILKNLKEKKSHEGACWRVVDGTRSFLVRGE
jgi:hypothetical protein